MKDWRKCASYSILAPVALSSVFDNISSSEHLRHCSPEKGIEGGKVGRGWGLIGDRPKTDERVLSSASDFRHSTRTNALQTSGCLEPFPRNDASLRLKASSSASASVVEESSTLPQNGTRSTLRLCPRDPPPSSLLPAEAICSACIIVRDGLFSFV